jgi:membrane associated rhomboid family serine protease
MLPGVKDMKGRSIFWTVAMAYAGFLLTGQGLQTLNSLSITEALLGALTGFLLAIMFTLRERRRQRPAFVTYSIEELFPNWGIPSEDRGSDPKPKR